MSGWGSAEGGGGGGFKITGKVEILMTRLLGHWGGGGGGGGRVGMEGWGGCGCAS